MLGRFEELIVCVFRMKTAVINVTASPTWYDTADEGYESKVMKISGIMPIMITDLNKFDMSWNHWFEFPEATTFSKSNGSKIALHKISLTKHFRARQLTHLDLLQAYHK